MSQPPTPYNRIFDFESFSIVNPTTQQPGVQIEGELDAIKTTLTSTISRLSEIQRDDGYLRDSSLDQSTIIPYFYQKLDILFQPVFLKKAGGEMDDAATILWSQTTTNPTNTVATAVSLNSTIIQGTLSYTAGPQYLQAWPVSLINPFGYWEGGTYSDVRKTTASKGLIELVRYGVGMNSNAPLAITPIGNITITAGLPTSSVSGGIFPAGGTSGQGTPHIEITDIHNGTMAISAYGISFADGSLQTTRGLPQNEVAQYVTAEIAGAVAGVNASITALIGAAPAALNTLSEIADAINDDANIATTLTNAISLKLATATAASTYQTLSGMSSYLTVSAASAAYYPLSNPTAFITASSLSPYLTTATAASTYQTVSGMSSYLTTSTASTTYAPKASPTFTGTVTIPSGASISGFALLASPTFTGDPKSVTPATSDNDTSIATTAFVKAQGYATSAAVAASFLTTSTASSTYLTQATASTTYLATADAPSDGSQYARYNGTWAVVSGGGGGSYLPLAGGTLTGAVVVTQINNTLNADLVIDSYNDTGAGTHYLHKFTPYDGKFNLATNGGGLVFPDLTVQTTATLTGPAGANGASGAMNYLDMLTVTSSSAGYYESGGTWTVYYGFMNNSVGWFYNKLNASGVDFKLYINGVYDSSGTGAFNYMSAGGTLVTTPVSGDVITIFLSGGDDEATIPLVIITI